MIRPGFYDYDVDELSEAKLRELGMLRYTNTFNNTSNIEDSWPRQLDQIAATVTNVGTREARSVLSRVVRQHYLGT
jgi:hypothetical protein